MTAIEPIISAFSAFSAFSASPRLCVGLVLSPFFGKR